jgi:YihY family inner membrane protein
MEEKMDNTTDLLDKQSLDSITPVSSLKQQDAHAVQTRRRAALALWAMGFLLLVIASVIVRFHPAPWPLDLQTTITLQHLQPQLPSWVSTPIVWASLVDNVLPSIISFSVSFVVLVLIGEAVWRRGGSPMPWFVTAIFISLVAGALNGLDGLIALIVSRPRPSSQLIHVFMPVPVHSFPSGHVENDVVFFGFLLYLSLTKPVSQWRYRWILIPIQLYAVLNILLIGYSRVVEGSHWLTDVLGGYLSGALLLVLLIVLYRWALDRLTTWYDRRSALTKREPQPTTDTMHEQFLQVVEKKMHSYEELFIKCKEDWIHHLAQSLAFSFLTALVPVVTLLLIVYHTIVGQLNTQMQQVLNGSFEAIIPPQLSSQAAQLFSKVFDTFSQPSGIALFLFTVMLAALFGSFIFSLMETSFDVIYHLPPRPFLHRHIVALGMLLLYLVLAPIIIVVAVAPPLILSLLHVTSPDHPIFHLVSIGGSIIFSLILFQAIYVVVPHRHVTLRTLGRHIRNSWRGAFVATMAMQMSLFLFEFYAARFLSNYIGEVGFVLLMLLYFYLFTLILLFGAEVNAFFAEGIRMPQNDLITQASRDGYR